MNKKLLEILVCPFDKVTPLDLIEFKVGSDAPSGGNPSNNDDNYLRSEPKILDSEDKNGSWDQKTENKTTVATEHTNVIEEGLLLCKICLRFFPIIEEIPIILPDDLRDKKKDIEFLRKWKESIPKDLVDNLKPWAL